MNYEQEYNKLFEYFSSRIQDKVTTSDRLIEEFTGYDVINQGDQLDIDIMTQMDYEREIKILEDLTLIIETLKIQLKELINLNQEELWKKVEDMISLCETRKNIYCSENDEPPERPEGFGFIGAKILEPKFPEIYSDEYVGPEAEETIQDNEIPDW